MRHRAPPFFGGAFLCLLDLRLRAYIITMSKGNGHDPDHKKKDKIIKFPSLAERDKMRREERKEEERWRKEYAKQRRAQSPSMINWDKIPPFARWLVGLILVVHIGLYVIADAGFRLKVFYMFGFVPAAFTGNAEWFWFTPLTPLTHMLIHGSWMHLLFNVVMGLALGIFFEKLYGTRATTKFFFICGLAGALGYFLLNMGTQTPVIGASGGISGLFAAALILMMQQNRGHPTMHKISKYGVWPPVVFWGLFMVIMGLVGGGDMAWQAHVGGYIVGAITLTLLQKGKIHL